MKKLLLMMLMISLCLTLVLSNEALAQSGDKDELIVYHWWTAGGEKEAIDALFESFKEKYPNIKIVENPVSGGGGGELRSQIKTNIMAGNPPDTFQITYGYGMVGSFTSVLQPVDQYLDDFNVPEEFFEWGKVDGKMYGVPINLMQNNCLWYNVELVNELGIDMPITSTEEFMTVCEKVKNAGYTPLAVGAGQGQNFWLGTLFESIFVSLPEGSASSLTNYYDGNMKPSECSAFRKTLEYSKKLIDNDYINSDYSALTWDQAADMMVNGDAVFYVMGDWSKGHFTAMEMEPNEDFAYQPFPGSSDTFIGHSDCFVLPKGVEKEVAVNWIKYLTTVEAENTFCPIKGATPPRLDAPVEGIYDEISQEILANFRNKDVDKVLSQFGAPPESYLDVFGTAFSEFFNDPMVDNDTMDKFDKAYNEVF